MTIEEAVQEIKDYIDSSNQAMLATMNNKLENLKEKVRKFIKENLIIKESVREFDKKLVGKTKYYQK